MKYKKFSSSGPKQEKVGCPRYGSVNVSSL